MRLPVKKVFLILASLPGFCFCAFAQTRVAPAFFGPNTFQVPRMLDGSVAGKFSLEIAADHIDGRCGETDRTSDLFLGIVTPLFSDRVNLSLWWVAREWYEMSPDVMAYRGMASSADPCANAVGAVFISTDILLVRELARVPGIAIRAAFRTASEDRAFPIRRGYDAAGYFFDASVGKSFGSFRLSASAGFLCWQTGTGTQNDALMYGIKAAFNARVFDFSAQFSGYNGWEKCGDCPATLLLHSALGPCRWSVRPYLEYQHGFRDWPFDQYRIGLLLCLN